MIERAALSRFMSNAAAAETDFLDFGMAFIPMFWSF